MGPWRCVINCFDISSITKTVFTGECLVPVNQFKVESFCLSPSSIRSALDQYNLMVPQIVLGWIRGVRVGTGM